PLPASLTRSEFFKGDKCAAVTPCSNIYIKGLPACQVNKDSLSPINNNRPPNRSDCSIRACICKEEIKVAFSTKIKGFCESLASSVDVLAPLAPNPATV